MHAFNWHCLIVGSHILGFAWEEELRVLALEVESFDSFRLAQF